MGGDRHKYGGIDRYGESDDRNKLVENLRDQLKEFELYSRSMAFPAPAPVPDSAIATATASASASADEVVPRVSRKPTVKATDAPRERARGGGGDRLSEPEASFVKQSESGNLTAGSGSGSGSALADDLDTGGVEATDATVAAGVAGNKKYALALAAAVKAGAAAGKLVLSEIMMR